MHPLMPLVRFQSVRQHLLFAEESPSLLGSCAQAPYPEGYDASDRPVAERGGEIESSHRRRRNLRRGSGASSENRLPRKSPARRGSIASPEGDPTDVTRGAGFHREPDVVERERWGAPKSSTPDPHHTDDLPEPHQRTGGRRQTPRSLTTTQQPSGTRSAWCEGGGSRSSEEDREPTTSAQA